PGRAGTASRPPRPASPIGTSRGRGGGKLAAPGPPHEGADLRRRRHPRVLDRQPPPGPRGGAPVARPDGAPVRTGRGRAAGEPSRARRVPGCIGRRGRAPARGGAPAESARPPPPLARRVTHGGRVWT